MSDPRFASDIYKTFSDAGSFYISDMKGAARHQAISFVAAGQNTGMRNAIENIIHNLSNDGDFVYTCSNYDYIFYQEDIDNTETLPTLNCKLDIDISSIDITTKDNKAYQLIAGIDFVQVRDIEPSSSLYGRYIKLKFTSTDIVGSKLCNIALNRLNINGVFTRDHFIRQSLLKSYTQVSTSYLGKNTEIINSYVGGSDQSPAQLGYALNAMCDTHYLEGTWQIEKVLESADKTDYIRYAVLKRVVTNTSSDSTTPAEQYKVIRLVMGLPSLAEGKDFVDELFPNYITFSQDFNKLSYIYSTVLTTTNKVEELKAIAAYLTPIGSTIEFVPNDIEESNIVRFRSRYNEYATLQVNDENGNNKDVTFEK